MCGGNGYEQRVLTEGSKGGYMQEFQATICQIAVFMICAQMITHFRPKECYAKYFRMLLSVMILVQIFQPFCKLFFGITGQELYAEVEKFRLELDKSVEEAAKQSVIAGEKLEHMSLMELQENLQERQGSLQDQQGNQQKQEGCMQEQQDSGKEQPTESVHQVETVQIDVEIGDVNTAEGKQVTERRGD